MLLVDEHLTPVLDEDVSGRAALVVEERTPQIGPRVPIHRRPFPFDTVQLLEFALVSALDFELPHDRDHWDTPPARMKMMVIEIDVRRCPAMRNRTVVLPVERSRVWKA